MLPRLQTRPYYIRRYYTRPYTRVHAKLRLVQARAREAEAKAVQKEADLQRQLAQLAKVAPTTLLTD